MKRQLQTCPPVTAGILRLLGWNTLLLVAGLALVAAGGEAWLRLTKPFMATEHCLNGRFIPEVGYLPAPRSVCRITNQLDYWTVQRANRFGFFDREPPSWERPDIAQSCHVTAIGDSFVMAKHVSIAAKFHVRLEELAAQRLPNLNVTTSAFGRDDTGQIAQLPFYDNFARQFRPKLVVLVFVVNDFSNNSPTLTAVRRGWDPDHPISRASARRDANGAMQLVPPSPAPQALVSSSDRRPRPLAPRMHLSSSWFSAWLNAKWNKLVPKAKWSKLVPEVKLGSLRKNAEELRRRPAYASLFDDGWLPTAHRYINQQFKQAYLPKVFEDALAFTAFALDQFQERTERDGVSLAVLASHTVGGAGHPAFERLRALIDARRIPLVSQHDHILRQGGRLRDAHFSHDNHWSAKGHQWTAEALLEHLAQHPEICAPRKPE